MTGHSIHVRVEPKLQKLIENEARMKKISEPELIRRVMDLRYVRKAASVDNDSFLSLFAGKPRKKVRSYEDQFSDKR